MQAPNTNYPEKPSKLRRGLDNIATSFWIAEKLFWWIPWTVGAIVILRKGYKIALLYRDFAM